MTFREAGTLAVLTLASIALSIIAVTIIHSIVTQVMT